MRIVIDLQGAQSSTSRNRGIGRYTNALSLGVAELARSRHELIIALNGQFDEAIEEVKDRFANLVEPGNFRVWNPPAHGQLVSAGGKRANEKLYEAFLSSLEPDVVLIASLFEGLSDAGVTSIGAFSRLRTATVLYDLIPLINAKPYLDNAVVREWYLRKVATLRRADMWFAISESSRQEGIRYLGLDPQRCINVSTAADPQFQIEDVPAKRAQDLRQRYGLQRPFVMYTGGIDLRKNIEGLIRAFALLPAALRGEHQLAIVCSARSQDKQALLDLARAEGLAEGDVVVTGFVPDEDLVTLYNLCHLFVFPSWHEGFGLPALEAMNCGAVVLGANTSSVPEVIGRSDALFNPHDPKAMAAKIEQGLTDEAFRKDLREHALEQARNFSWSRCAQKAMDGLERLNDLNIELPRPSLQGVRPRLAYVSPLPPERSGIANYSAELIPYLARHYDIELISDLPVVEDTMLAANFPVRSTGWLRENPRHFDRVLYHFGNSEFHQHMFDLLAEVPGVVVQHDFFLSGLQSYLEEKRKNPLAWVQSLYASHGYTPLAERFESQGGAAKVLFKYPVSFDVLAQAQGVIVHSLHAIDLARQWFAPQLSRDWAMVPLPRTLKQVSEHERLRIRRELGLADDEFMVCTFGIIGSTKLSLRLIEAWQASPMSKSAQCHLVFVGDNDAGPYGNEVAQALVSAAEGSIRITGWASNELFEKYLAAADLAVQLRTQSRGETSATVLDTLSHGVPTIVNANGSMADLPDIAVWKLPEEFSTDQLTQALTTLWSDPQARSELAGRGRQLIGSNHMPADCARRYFDAIETSAARAARSRDGLVSAIRADWESSPDTAAGDAPAVAQAIADSLPPPAPARQLLVDVSELVRRDASTGIQRVVKGLLRELLDSPPDGFRVEPVYAVQGELGYRYARQFTLEFLGCPRALLVDLPIDARAGDVFVGLDLEPRIVLAQRAFYRQMRQRGVRVEFVVYDLLPILMPDRFMKGAEELHAVWLGVVAESDGALCISRSVADELRHWVATDERAGTPRAGFTIGAFHLGVDALPEKVKQDSDWDAKLRAAMSSRPTFLMVGTIEPRKGHALVLDAFDRLWARGLDVNLVLVGREGWMVEALVKKLKTHPRLGKQLFWIERADDALLDRLYAAASCLIAASEGEGFGLPLIEAAQRGLPVLARDIPVFREVGGGGASYFAGDPDSLADVAAQWLANRQPATIHHLSWRESAEQFKHALRIAEGT